MALADATIYVPTQRAAQRWPKALLSASGAQSLLLPRIAPLGAFEPDETATFFEAEQEEAPRPAPAGRGRSDLTRRHTLACLTRAWGRGAAAAQSASVDADGRLIVDRFRAGARRDDPRPGLCARGRSCRADRRHDHRGRDLDEARNACPRSLRFLLAHHPRLSQDRVRALAGMARRARSDRPREAGRASDRERNQGAGGRSAGAARRSSPARQAPIARPPASSRRLRAAPRARSFCRASTSISTTAPGR